MQRISLVLAAVSMQANSSKQDNKMDRYYIMNISPVFFLISNSGVAIG